MLPILCGRTNGMGNDLFVDAAESASFPLPGTGKREGGEKTQPFNHFESHLVRGCSICPLKGNSKLPIFIAGKFLCSYEYICVGWEEGEAL